MIKLEHLLVCDTKQVCMCLFHYVYSKGCTVQWLKNQIMHVIMVLKSARHTKTKDGCKLCSCTAIVNGFKISLDGTVERARRQR
jgi:hypothetical protein